jgi:hypothetical protein
MQAREDRADLFLLKGTFIKRASLRVQLFTLESSTLWLLEKKHSQQLCGTQKFFFF